MAKPQVLESTVLSVSVFRSGAVVTRVASIPGADWPDEVAIDGLPLALDDQSVRVSVFSPHPAAALPRPGDVRVSLAVPPLGEPMQPPSETELRDASDQVVRLQTHLQRIDQELALLASVRLRLAEPMENRPPRPAPAAAWRGVIEWTRSARAARVQEKAQLSDELMRARETWARLQRRDQEARAGRDSRQDAISKRVILRLRDGGVFAPSELRLEYRVPGARWVPTYTFRMARDGRTASLAVRALIVQQTGEPWDRVKLSVSTADLLREADLPELKSLRIGRRQPPVLKRAWREPPTGSESLLEGLDRALSTMPPPPPIAPPDTPPMPPPPPVAPPAASPYPSDDRSRTDGITLGGFVGAPPMPEESQVFHRAKPQAKSMRPTEMSPQPAMPSRPVMAPGSMAPAPMAPAPMAASAPLSALRRQAVGMRAAATEGFGGSEDMKKDAIERDEESSSADEPFLQPAGIAPEPATMRYSELMMAGWDGPYPRGKLRAMTIADRLSGVDPAVAPEAARRLAEAESRALQTAYVLFPADTREVATSSGAYDHRYDADGLVDVPSDGKIHSVPLFTRSAPVSTTLIVVPRESDQAVRVAAMKNPLEAPLLAGPAEIYLEDEFLVTSPIRTVPAGAELQVGLGVEEAIKVARNVHFDEEAHGVFGGGTTLQHRVVIEIASRLASPAKLEVRERVPIKQEQDKEIEVLVPESNPPWEDYDQAEISPIKGGKRWRFTLAAGESKKLEFSYLIKIAGKNEIAGGNRRE